MAKTITFTYEGNNYVLEFTRKSIETMEKQGFIISQVSDKPMSVLPTLFRGAFIAHHKFTKTETIDKIFAKMPNREELFSTLVEMYNEPIVALMNEPESSEGNIDWAKN